MPASPKLKSTPLPRVTIVRRGSAQVARRFFLGRGRNRRVLLLICGLLLALYYFHFRSDDPYNMQFMDDDDETIVKPPNSAKKEHLDAVKAIKQQKDHKVRKRPPMSRSHDGLIRVGGWEGHHPLLEVMSSAEQDWNLQADLRPSTLSEAYDSYQALYGESPPPSYHNFFVHLSPQCPLPSLSSIRLYRPITSSMIKGHQLAIEGSPMTLTVGIKNGRVGGGAADENDGLFHLRDLSHQLMSMVQEISELLPDLRFTLSVDAPRNPLPYSLRMDLKDHQRLGDQFDEGDSEEEGEDANGLFSYRGWQDACAPFDPLKGGSEIPEHSNNTLKFIYSHAPLSPCQHPSLLSLSNYFASPSPNFGIMHPVFAFTRTTINGDVLLPRPDASSSVSSKVPWGSKRNVLYWRGMASPGSSSNELAVPINRLMNLYNPTSTTSKSQQILVPTENSSFELREDIPTRVLKTQIDLAFMGCGDRVGCGDMRERYTFVDNPVAEWEQAKFVLDLESFTSGSTSFRQLLLTGSLVLRSSLFEDFWVAQARPWVHYVPVQPDFSDLATILLFFETHDHLAKRIATAGQAIARECFGRAGVKAGLIGVLGEYGRMWGDNRSASRPDES